MNTQKHLALIQRIESLKFFYDDLNRIAGHPYTNISINISEVISEEVVDRLRSIPDATGGISEIKMPGDISKYERPLARAEIEVQDVQKIISEFIGDIRDKVMELEKELYTKVSKDGMNKFGEIVEEKNTDKDIPDNGASDTVEVLEEKKAEEDVSDEC